MDILLQRWDSDLVLLRENSALYAELAGTRGGLTIAEKLRARTINREIVKMEKLVSSRKEALHV